MAFSIETTRYVVTRLAGAREAPFGIGQTVYQLTDIRTATYSYLSPGELKDLILAAIQVMKSD